MSTSGYYRFPTINGDLVVFVSEDDLWSFNLSDSSIQRLTSNYGAVSCPRISPDGKKIAFVGTEDGDSEIYVMPSEGGPAKRLTFL